MPAAVQTRRLTREEYHRAAESGRFNPDERIELFEGEVIHKVSPQRRPHRKGVRRAGKALETALGPEFVIWAQLPLVLSDYTEPEPDVMVLYGPEDRYDDKDAEASDVALIVEIADTSLTFDRTEKASRYAKSGIRDYWVLDLYARRVEVRRDPQPDLHGPHGYAYQTVRVCAEGETVVPLAAPDVTVQVRDLVPKETRVGN